MAALGAVDGYPWDKSKDELEGLARKYAPQLLELAYEESGMGISFDLANPRVKDKIADAAKRIVGIADTTKEQIRGAVERGLGEGLSPAKIAAQIRESAPDISRSRAMTILRTETREMYNGGTLLAYDEAGVKKVEALDSDEDEECAARNGQIFTIEEAAEVEAHPNCVLAWLAVVD